VRFVVELAPFLMDVSPAALSGRLVAPVWRMAVQCVEELSALVVADKPRAPFGRLEFETMDPVSPSFAELLESVGDDRPAGL
jgi:hypothetical protein